MPLHRERDPWGRPYYASVTSHARYVDRVETEASSESARTVITPVTRVQLELRIRSGGPDLRPGTSDDFTLGEFTRIVTEQHTVMKPPKTRAEIVASNGYGGIRGDVRDASGAVLPGVNLRLSSPELMADRVDDLAKKRHAFLEIVTTVPVISNVRVRAKKVREQIVHPH